MCISVEILSRAHGKGEEKEKKKKTTQKNLNDFKFATFIGRFPSDGSASVAVKGLNRMFFISCTVNRSVHCAAGIVWTQTANTRREFCPQISLPRLADGRS